MRPGAYDLIIYYPTKTFHGLFLEVKRNKHYTPSEMKTATWIAQELFGKTVKKVGYEAKICYGFAHGIEIIEAYLLS